MSTRILRIDDEQFQRRVLAATANRVLDFSREQQAVIDRIEHGHPGVAREAFRSPVKNGSTS